MTAAMADRHLSGAEPSVELAAIGRRACEQEFDVLLALGLDSPDPAPPPEPDVPDGSTDLFGRPGAAELVEAVHLFLTADVGPGTSGRTSFHFHARVAANVLATVRRELLRGPAARGRHRARLVALGLADDDAFSAAITDGTLDHRWDEVVATLRADVRDRLLVASPRHLCRDA